MRLRSQLGYGCLQVFGNVHRQADVGQDFTQDLSSAALSFTTTTAGDKPFHLDQIVMRFSQAVSETITITLDSNEGANYDVVLQEVVLSSETDFVYRPQGEANFNAGDEIKVECTASGGAGTVYGVVKTSEIS